MNTTKGRAPKGLGIPMGLVRRIHQEGRNLAIFIIACLSLLVKVGGNYG